MNDVQERLRAAFNQQAEAVRPHGDARGALDRRIRVSGRRRRMIAVVAIVGLGAGGFSGFRELRPSDRPEAVALTDGLRAIHALPHTVTITGTVPGGGLFRVEALGPDGTVVGRTADSRVWRAGPRGGTPTSLGVRAQGGLAAGSGEITWIPTGTWDLRCRGADGRIHTISPQAADPQGPVWINGDTIVWQDIMHQPFKAQGCSKPGTFVGNNATYGGVVAFDHPSIVRLQQTEKSGTPTGTGLVVIDTRTGRVVSRMSLPPGVPPILPACGNLASLTPVTSGPTTAPRSPSAATACSAQPNQWSIAAGHDLIAWANAGSLHLAPQGAWKHTITLPYRLPQTTNQGQTRISVGNHFVVYSSSTGVGRSVIYDLHTHQTMTQVGSAFTNGDWLVWQDGQNYELTHVTG